MSGSCGFSVSAPFTSPLSVCLGVGGFDTASATAPPWSSSSPYSLRFFSVTLERYKEPTTLWLPGKLLVRGVGVMALKKEPAAAAKLAGTFVPTSATKSRANASAGPAFVATKSITPRPAFPVLYEIPSEGLAKQSPLKSAVAESPARLLPMVETIVAGAFSRYTLLKEWPPFSFACSSGLKTKEVLAVKVSFGIVCGTVARAAPAPNDSLDGACFKASLTLLITLSVAEVRYWPPPATKLAGVAMLYTAIELFETPWLVKYLYRSFV